MSQQRRAYLVLLFGVFAFAFSPIFVSLAQVNGLTATLYRSGVGAMVMTVPFAIQRPTREATKPSLKTVVKIGATGGLLFALNNGLFNTAITFIPASNAIFLANTAVIWVGLVSIFLYKEQLGGYFWVGVALALVGVLLITTEGRFSAEIVWSGNLIALAGGFFYGLNILYNNVARRTLNAITYMTLFNTTAALLIFSVILIVGVQFRGFDAATYWYLFGLGFISQGLGFLAVVQSQAYLPASRVSTILLAQPLIVLVLAYFILDEQPSLVQACGIAVLFVGIVLANNRPKQGIKT